MAPSASLSCLSDISLLHIFSALPVVELFQAQCLSRRLGKLASTGTRHRQSLILYDGSTSLAYLTYIFPQTNLNLLRKSEMSSRRVKLRRAHPAILRLRPPTGVRMSSRRGCLPLEPLSANLPILLPNIHRLYVSVKGDATTLQTVVFLLEAWAPQLSRFHLHFDILEPTVEANIEEIVTLFYDSLCATINAFSATFRYLHLDINLGSFSRTKLPELHLPIVKQLQCFYFRVHRFARVRVEDGIQPLSELVHHVGSGGTSVSSLGCFAIENGVTLNGLLQVPAYLANRLVKVVLSEPIIEATLPTFARLCRGWAIGEHGGSLKELTVTFSVPLYSLVEAMAPLTKLIHLQLNYFPIIGPIRAPEEAALLRLPSVRSLTFFHIFTRHAQFEQLALPVHFPEIQVAWVVNCSLNCDDCSHRWHQEEVSRPKIAGLDRQLALQCDTVDHVYLRQRLPKLRAIILNRRLNWTHVEPVSVLRAPWV